MNPDVTVLLLLRSGIMKTQFRYQPRRCHKGPISYWCVSAISVVKNNTQPMHSTSQF